MNGKNFRLPARRLAGVATAAALTAGPAVLGAAGTAHATGDEGRASAAVLRTGLDVSLLNKRHEWHEYRSEVTAFELRKNLPVL